MEEEKSKLPETKFRAGAVSATVWKNSGETKTGDRTSYYSVSIDRLYKDRNDKWQATNSLRVNDMPKAVLVLQKAYEYVIMSDSKVRSSDSPVA